MIMKMGITKRFCLITAFTLCGMTSASAQEMVDNIVTDSNVLDSKIESVSEEKPKRKLTKWGACIEGSIMGNSDMPSFGWGLQGCYRFNTNFNVGLGFRVLYWDGYSESWHDNGYLYTYEKETDDNGESSWRRQYDLTLSATYILPIIKRAGIALGGTVLLSPIPYEQFEVSRTPITFYDDSYHHHFSEATESKNKYVYDAFQPGLFAEVGLYYDINENGEKSRFTLMYGIGTFDMFMGSRHSKVFDQKLGDHLPSKKLCHSLTLRLSVF